ncbi:Coiled-coil domain containing protein 40 [Dissostichus eleginoides]|uniref:Coiled-coil domain containing protein 40 n=1 Tax=Dissostichus eleginoides TaxID=100907 RepID=A0AAD9EY06_DISEL|nr:Coiled-coil domain containing protein 40 [Dissostichus eleginoides]
MQSTRGEGGEGAGEEEARPEGSRQTEEVSELQDGGKEAAEDRGAPVLAAATQSVSQNQSGPEPDDTTPQLRPVHTGLDDFSAATNSEFIVLDSEHPLVRRQQVALNRQLSNQLERIDLGLKEKLANEKEDDKHLQELGVGMYGVQEQLARLQTRLDDRQHTKAEAEAKRQQARDQLEEIKRQYSNITGQDRKDKANASQLQAEIDNLMQHLVFTQGVSEDLSSNVKALKNARRKAGAEKNQAEEQKFQQDLYVERLTKDKERLTEQIAMYEAQAKAQAEETHAAKEALSEAEMEMESLVLARNQLLQQWSGSLVGMRRRDEAFSAMQDAVRTVEHQVILLDREIEGYKRSTNEEQEENEKLTMQLNWSHDGATSRKLIIQKQAQGEALQAHYSSCLRTLRETERTLARLSKETSAHHAEVIDQRRQLQKESAVRLEIEDKIMTHIQQKLTHNKAAKYSQRLTSRIATLKREKSFRLWQLENDVVAVGQEISKASQHLESLGLTTEALDEKIARSNKLLTTIQAKMSSFVTLIAQKQASIATCNKKIYQIAAKTGHEDLSPLQIKVEAIRAQIEELAVRIKSDQQLWMMRQGTLVAMTHEIEANSKEMLKLQTEYTAMQQKKIRWRIEAEHHEETELEKNAKMLRGDLLKLNTLLSKNSQLSQALEQENALRETDFLHRLKEAERESIQMQIKHERIQEEKERILNSLVEAERQIMLWEKKIQLVKETRSAVDSEVDQGDIQIMKAEIHRMEVRLNHLLKQQERLLKESEATVERREVIVLRREAMFHTSKKRTTKGEVNRVTQGLQRKIHDTHKRVVEYEQGIRELQEGQVRLSELLAQQKQKLSELCGTSYVLDPEFENLQDTKERNLAHLVSLQSRMKKLQGVCEGSYRASATSESVAAALQSQMERVRAAGTILQRVCEEFPQHQGALRRLALALAARTQTARTQVRVQETS